MAGGVTGAAGAGLATGLVRGNALEARDAFREMQSKQHSNQIEELQRQQATLGAQISQI